MTTTLTVTSGQTSFTAQGYTILPSPGTAVPDSVAPAIVAQAYAAGVVLASSAGTGVVTVPSRRFTRSGVGPPQAGEGRWQLGDEVVDSNNTEWENSAPGDPGTWTQPGSGTTGLAPTAVKTGAYTAAVGDFVPVDTTAGPVTITLPTAPADKAQIGVKLVVQGGSNTVTIARGGSSDVFNKAGGSTSLTLTSLNHAITLQYKASTGIWYVLVDSIARVALDSSYGPTPGLTNFRGLTPVGRLLAAGVNFSSFSDGTKLGGTSRVWVPIVEDVFDAMPILDNSANDQANANAITVACGIERLDGTILPLFYNGQHTITLPPGARAIPDYPAAVNALAADGGFWVRTYVSVASLGMVWPQPYNPSGAQSGTTHSYSASGGADTTSPGSGAVTNTASSFWYFAPSVVLGSRKTRRVPIWGLVGDSITTGKGANNAQNGFSERAAATQKAAVVNVAAYGEYANGVNAPAQYLRRMSYLMGCTHAISTYGHNDIGAGGALLAALQVNWLLIWTKLANRGMAVYQTTLCPRTTSTDNWATTANQTKQNDAQRLLANAWLRAGAPIDPSTKAAVAIGTSGALLAGSTGHPLTGYIDIADVVETARDSGLWAVNGTAFYSTGDGVHPSDAFHALMAAVVPQLPVPSVPLR